MRALREVLLVQTLERLDSRLSTVVFLDVLQYTVRVERVRERPAAEIKRYPLVLAQRAHVRGVFLEAFFAAAVLFVAVPDVPVDSVLAEVRVELVRRDAQGEAHGRLGVGGVEVREGGAQAQEGEVCPGLLGCVDGARGRCTRDILCRG